MSTRAIIRSAIAPLQLDARASAPQTSQLLRGHSADVLERTESWVKVRGADGYDGWCHVGHLRLEQSADSSPIRSAWLDERRMSLGCTVRHPDGTFATLPLGALLDPDEIAVSGLAMNHRGRARYFARQADSIVQRTMQLFSGTPYQWGGVTPWGADCSGMVQTMFALAGVQLPRDAWQQAEVGVRLAGDLSELQPADLLYYSDRDDGKITHVAMSVGGPGVVHSSLMNGGYGVNSMEGSDAVSLGLRATFRFAARVL